MVALDQSLSCRAMSQGAAVAARKGLTNAPIFAKGLRSGSAQRPCGRGGGRSCRSSGAPCSWRPAIVALLGGAQASAQIFGNLSVRPKRVPRTSSLAARISARERPLRSCSPPIAPGATARPQGLAKNRSATGLGEFMREHYTNSREVGLFARQLSELAAECRTPAAHAAGPGASYTGGCSRNGFGAASTGINPRRGRHAAGRHA